MFPTPHTHTHIQDTGRGEERGRERMGGMGVRGEKDKAGPDAKGK